MAIRSFRDKATDDICHSLDSKQSRSRLPKDLHAKARLRMAVLAAATSLTDLAEIRGNRLEALKGDRKGQFSIRINDQYRICFLWEGSDAAEVEVVDYH